jgi:hypothetical protein
MLEIRHGDTIIKAPSFLLLQMTPQSINAPIMTFADAMQRRK